MGITLTPTQSEFVDIEHRGWGARWSIQFPEAIESAEGTIMAWPRVEPRWRALGPGAWGYTWEPTGEYAESVLAKNLKATDGSPQYHTFVPARLDTRIAVEDGGVSLKLTLTNTGARAVTKVRSEGGCLQAKSDAFRDGEEVARSHVRVGGAMTSMAKLDRSIPIRCRYVIDATHVARQFEWFWGRTQTMVDGPAVVGAVSRDGSNAIALGYAHAAEAMQNADDHHCLHSGPYFGTLAPGESVTRRGWILFGEDIHALGREISRRIAAM